MLCLGFGDGRYIGTGRFAALLLNVSGKMRIGCCRLGKWVVCGQELWPVKHIF